MLTRGWLGGRAGSEAERGARLQLELLLLLLLHMQIMENVLEFSAKVNNMLIAQTRNTPKRVCAGVSVCVCGGGSVGVCV